jgi:SPFH domain / Band 7 family
VSREIRKILTERARNFNIALDDVSITSLSFGKEFTHAIEAKQVAAQEAERAKFIVDKAEQDKKSAIIRAQVLLLPLYLSFFLGFATKPMLDELIANCTLFYPCNKNHLKVFVRC